MTNTYSGDPSTTDKDALRFLLSDTSAPWLFTDEEIQYMIDNHGSIYNAGVELSLVMVSRYTDKKNKTVGPLSINYGDIAERWLELSNSLRRRSSTTSGAKVVMTQKTKGHIFTIGMNDINNSTEEEKLLGGKS